MADTQTLDKAYHVIISSMVDTGQAPTTENWPLAWDAPSMKGARSFMISREPPALG